MEKHQINNTYLLQNHTNRDMDLYIVVVCTLAVKGIHCLEHIRVDNLVRNQYNFLNNYRLESQKSFDTWNLDHMVMVHNLVVVLLAMDHQHELEIDKNFS